MSQERQTLITQICNETIPHFIARWDGAKNAWDINNGGSDEYADAVELILRTEHNVDLYTLGTTALADCYLCHIEDDLSVQVVAIFCAALNEMKEALAGYGTELTMDQFIIDMPDHVFLYDSESQRYFDAELPEGSERIMDIPVIQRAMLFSLMEHTSYYHDKPDELKTLVFDIIKNMLAGDPEQGDKWNSAADIIKDACTACPSLALDVEQVIREITAPPKPAATLADSPSP